MATITDSIGRVLASRYRIESALGSGASAHVFAAWDVSLQRRVAVKVLHPALVGDGAFLRRFRAEARAAASLAHPHVLSVHDWGEDDSGPFLVLEFLGGGSLRDLLDTGNRLSLPQALKVGIQASEGLAFAHNRGFVHRDVKPANLLFGEDGRLRVADFGLARALAEAAWTEPAGATVGTARYAAPEQAQGRPVDGRADVYGLALVLYEAVTGIVPFATDTTLGTLMGRVGAHLPGHDALGPLGSVLGDAAAPEPENRMDASSLEARLRQIADSLPDAEPLSLAGPAGRGLQGPPSTAGFHEGRNGAGLDHTEHGLSVASAGSEIAARGAGPDAGHGSDPEPTERSSRRVSRRLRGVLAVIAAAVVVAGGTAFALVAGRVFVPSHRLPSLVGTPRQSAASELGRLHLAMAVSGRKSSMTVPAGRILHESPAPGTYVKQGTTVDVVLSSGPPPRVVPSLAAVHGDCAGASALLVPVGFKVTCTHQSSTSVAAGSVIDWSPKGEAPYGSSISVTVSSGPPIETIPSLDGSTCQGATTTLRALGLAAACRNIYSTSVASGQVVDWNPTGTAPQGSTVTVDVSQGPPPVIVPDVDGHTVSDAINMLEAAGLVPASDQGPLNGHVFASNPPQGASVPEGTPVTLYSR